MLELDQQGSPRVREGRERECKVARSRECVRATACQRASTLNRDLDGDRRLASSLVYLKSPGARDATTCVNVNENENVCTLSQLARIQLPQLGGLLDL